jgi:hypothetical protein
MSAFDPLNGYHQCTKILQIMISQLEKSSPLKEEELRFLRGQADVSVHNAVEGLSAMTVPFVS